MNNNHLVHMCNQIGIFFESMPDRQKAMEDFANHLKKFWAPSMRHQLFSGVDQGEAEEMNPLAIEALNLYRDKLLN